MFGLRLENVARVLSRVFCVFRDWLLSAVDIYKVRIFPKIRFGAWPGLNADMCFTNK
jgi:hypothetical protein